jgi:hypothetical protein
MKKNNAQNTEEKAAKSSHRGSLAKLISNKLSKKANEPIPSNEPTEFLFLINVALPANKPSKKLKLKIKLRQPTPANNKVKAPNPNAHVVNGSQKPVNSEDRKSAEHLYESIHELDLEQELNRGELLNNVYLDFNRGEVAGQFEPKLEKSLRNLQTLVEKDEYSNEDESAILQDIIQRNLHLKLTNPLFNKTLIKSVHPLTVVFTNMLTHQLFKALTSCHQVSKEWSQLASQVCRDHSPEKLVLDERFFVNNPFVASTGKLYGLPPKKIYKPLDKINRYDLKIIPTLDLDEKVKSFFESVSNRILKYINCERVTNFDMSRVRHRLRSRIFLREYFVFLLSNFENLNFLDLSGIRTNVLFEGYFNTQVLSFYGRQLIELNLSWSNLNDGLVIHILKNCPALEVIDVTGTWLSNGSWLDHVQNNKSKLTSISCTLNDEQTSTDYTSLLKSFEGFLERYQNLKCLRLFSAETDVKKMDYDGNEKIMTALASSGSTLTELKIRIQREEILPEIDAVNFLSLTELDLSYSFYPKNIHYTISRLLCICQGLKVLKLNYCDRITDVAFHMQTIRCELEELHLAGADLTYKTIKKLQASILKDSLRVLNIADFKFESSKQVLSLIDGFPNLCKIQVPFCTLFNDENNSDVLPRLLEMKERAFSFNVMSDNDQLVDSFFAERTVSLSYKEIQCQNLRLLFFNMFDGLK